MPDAELVAGLDPLVLIAFAGNLDNAADQLEAHADAVDPGEPLALANELKKEAAMNRQLAALCRAVATQLLPFAGKALQVTHGCNGGDWDGSDVEDALVACGLLESREVTGPCDEESCVCADVGGFPCQCYFPTVLGAAALGAVAEREK